MFETNAPSKEAKMLHKKIQKKKTNKKKKNPEIFLAGRKQNLSASRQFRWWQDITIKIVVETLFHSFSDVSRTFQVGGGELEGHSANLGGQHQVQILGSAPQTPKYVLLHTAIPQMSNFIEVHDYIH